MRRLCGRAGALARRLRRAGAVCHRRCMGAAWPLPCRCAQAVWPRRHRRPRGCSRAASSSLLVQAVGASSLSSLCGGCMAAIHVAVQGLCRVGFVAWGLWGRVIVVTCTRALSKKKKARRCTFSTPTRLVRANVWGLGGVPHLQWEGALGHIASLFHALGVGERNKKKGGGGGVPASRASSTPRLHVRPGV